MRIIEPYVEVWPFDATAMLKNIEMAGRTTYKSEGKITGDSHIDFIKKIIQSGHESVLEHEKITVKFVVDRGVSHELVRHRIASYTQESTRYCNYGQDRFGKEITFIRPFFFPDRESEEYLIWEETCRIAENNYISLLRLGATPQEARSVLPNSLKTEVVMTANLREWRHFFTLRCAPAAHPQMRQVAIPLLVYLGNRLPLVFGDIRIGDCRDMDFAEVREG